MVRAGLDENKERQSGMHFLRPVSLTGAAAAAGLTGALLLTLPNNTQQVAAALGGALASGGARYAQSVVQGRKLLREKKIMVFTLLGGVGSATAVYFMREYGNSGLLNLSAASGAGAYLGTWAAQEYINSLN